MILFTIKLDVEEKKREWFDLLEKRVEEVKHAAKMSGKLMSDGKARFIAKTDMPDFPGNSWKD